MTMTRIRANAYNPESPYDRTVTSCYENISYALTILEAAMRGEASTCACSIVMRDDRPVVSKPCNECLKCATTSRYIEAGRADVLDCLHGLEDDARFTLYLSEEGYLATKTALNEAHGSSSRISRAGSDDLVRIDIDIEKREASCGSVDCNLAAPICDDLRAYIDAEDAERK